MSEMSVIRLALAWNVRYSHPTAVFPNVTIHFFGSSFLIRVHYEHVLTCELSRSCAIVVADVGFYTI